jgi:C4-dicarboxylate-binding protein DctP
VQKYMTLTNHGYIGYVVVVNKKFWDGLPADIRGQLVKAMDESTAFGNGKSEQENADALAEIKKAGKTEFITPTADETTQMRKAMEPIYADMEKRVGKGLIEEVQQAVAGASH